MRRMNCLPNYPEEVNLGYPSLTLTPLLGWNLVVERGYTHTPALLTL